MSNATVTGDTIRNASPPMPSNSPGSYRFSTCSWSPCNERSLRNIPRSAGDFPPGKTHHYSRWGTVEGQGSMVKGRRIRSNFATCSRFNNAQQYPIQLSMRRPPAIKCLFCAQDDPKCGGDERSIELGLVIVARQEVD